MAAAKLRHVQCHFVAFELAGRVNDGHTVVQERRIEVLFRRIQRREVLDLAPAFAVTARDEQVVLAAAAVPIAREHESLAVGRDDRSPFIAGRVDLRTEIPAGAVAPRARVERREIEVVLANPPSRLEKK